MIGRLFAGIHGSLFPECDHENMDQLQQVRFGLKVREGFVKEKTNRCTKCS